MNSSGEKGSFKTQEKAHICLTPVESDQSLRYSLRESLNTAEICWWGTQAQIRLCKCPSEVRYILFSCTQ